MAKKTDLEQTWKGSNPDLRRKPQCPSPPVELIEQRLWELLSPATFKPLKASQDVDGHALRNRLLTLPVMVTNENYQFCTVCSEYGGIKQRWIIV